MKEFIKWRSREEGFVVNTDVGNVCNYRCSYCTTHLNKKPMWLDIDPLKKFLEMVTPGVLILGGAGEPTIHPKFLELIKLSKELFGCKICICTNLTREKAWWKKVLDIIDEKDEITTSYHIEHAEIDDFCGMIDLLSRHRKLFIHVPTMPERFEECINVREEIKKRFKHILVFLKVLINRPTRELRLKEYTKEQLEIIHRVIFDEIPKEPPTFKEYSDGSKERTSALEIFTNGEIKFEGWRCWKGVSQVQVLRNGDINRGQCENVGKTSYEPPIGNINNLSKIKLPTVPDICRDKAGCQGIMDLVYSSKEKIK